MSPNRLSIDGTVRRNKITSLSSEGILDSGPAERAAFTGGSILNDLNNESLHDKAAPAPEPSEFVHDPQGNAGQPKNDEGYSRKTHGSERRVLLCLTRDGASTAG